MCSISKIGRDWIVKGCHIHVYGIELAVRPDHRGGIVFKKMFHAVSDSEAQPAIARATEKMRELAWRSLLHREVMRARNYLRGVHGKLSDIAQGRAAELTFLSINLRKMGII